MQTGNRNSPVFCHQQVLLLIEVRASYTTTANPRSAARKPPGTVKGTAALEGAVVVCDADAAEFDALAAELDDDCALLLLAEAELTDAELDADTELADAELADAELADTELADAELPDAELAEEAEADEADALAVSVATKPV